MADYSKIITTLPIIIGLLMIGVEFTTEFTITESQVQLIEFIIGGTIFGGVANKGYKRFVEYKTKAIK